MEKLRSQALQAAKEIVVKFIETGRISPGNFHEHFAPIYAEILRTIAAGEADLPPAPEHKCPEPKHKDKHREGHGD